MKQFMIVLALSLITQTQAQSYGYPPTALDQAGTVVGALNQGLQYYNYNNPNRPQIPNQGAMSHPSPFPPQPYNQGYGNCAALDGYQFNQLLQMLEDAMLMDREDLAYNLTSNRALSTQQIRTISGKLMLMNRFEFIKASYRNCVDKNNYYDLSSQLMLMDRKEFNTFLMHQR